MENNIKDYDCSKAYILVEKRDYLELKLKGIQTFEEAQLIEKNFSNNDSSFILKFRGIQLIGNSL